MFEPQLYNSYQLYFTIPTFCFRLSAHSHVWPELEQPQPCDQLWRCKQEHHVCGLSWRWTLDVHRRRRLHGSNMGPEVRKPDTLGGTEPLEVYSVERDPHCSLQVKESPVSEDIPGQCSNQLRLSASQPGKRAYTRSYIHDTFVHL